jgi:hypothetical protein
MSDRARTPRRDAGLLVVIAAIALAVGTTVLGAQGRPVHAETPSPSEAIVGDTRSPGEGPGLVGAPFLAIGGVLALGLAAAGLTLVYVRATGGSGSASRFSPPDERRDRPTTRR